MYRERGTVGSKSELIDGKRINEAHDNRSSHSMPQSVNGKGKGTSNSVLIGKQLHDSPSTSLSKTNISDGEIRLYPKISFSSSSSSSSGASSSKGGDGDGGGEECNSSSGSGSREHGDVDRVESYRSNDNGESGVYAYGEEEEEDEDEKDLFGSDNEEYTKTPAVSTYPIPGIEFD